MGEIGRPPVVREAVLELALTQSVVRRVVPSPESATRTSGHDGGSVRRAYRALVASGDLAYDTTARVYYLPETPETEAADGAD